MRALVAEARHRLRVARHLAHRLGPAPFHCVVQGRQHADEHAGRIEAGPELERAGRHLPDDVIAARLGRAHRVEQVATHAGLVVGVEHGADHDRLAACGGELLVPLEVVQALLAVEQQCRGAPS